MRIYLIGMPGVGKTSLGKELALKIKYNFLDLDSYIEAKAGHSIKEIFNDGESYFRALEAKALKESLALNNTVISCGGGIVKDLKNKALMDGLIIYLSLPLEKLEKRITGDARPLLKSNSLASLFKERENKYYYFAKHIILNEKMDVALDLILRRLKNEDISY